MHACMHENSHLGHAKSYGRNSMSMIYPCRKLRLLTFATALVVSAPTGLAQALGITFFSSGPDASAITPSVDAFRSDLGSLNPNVTGSFGTGRREINWDAVPANFSAPNLLPNNFFNVIRRVARCFPHLGRELRSARTPQTGQYGLETSTRITPRCFKCSVRRSYSPQSVRTL